MTDKLVSYDDLSTLRAMRNHAAVGRTAAEVQILDRLVAAAEADQPPIPEGWVLLAMEEGHHEAVWHSEGHLYRIGGAMPRWPIGYPDTVGYFRDRLTPLCPTITEADVEKAWVAWHAPDVNTTKDRMRAAFAAAGIEVRDDS